MSLNQWFEKGMTFNEYRDSMKVNKQELDNIYEQFVLSDEDASFLQQHMNENWRGIVLTADWCGDAALCVPILAKIAKVSNIELRYLIRDENLELMDQYLTNGTARAIPIFIFITPDGKEIKVWGPRSPQVEDLITSLRANLPAHDAADFQEKQQQMYKYFKEKITTDHAIWDSVVQSVKQKLI